MSNADLEFIKAGASTLDPRQSNASFEANIVQLYNFAALKAGQQPVNSMEEIKNMANKPVNTVTSPTQPGVQNFNADSVADSLISSWK